MPPLVCTDKLCFKANASLTKLHRVAPVSTMNLILERQLEPGRMVFCSSLARDYHSEAEQKLSSVNSGEGWE